MMKMMARDIKPGVVMMSGEVVTKTRKSGGLGMSNKEMVLLLHNPKTDKSRYKRYAYYGMLNVKDENEE